MTKQCNNCERAKAEVKGLCVTCYKYERRTGKPRPKELYEPKPVFCTNCKENEVYCRELCVACYSWKKRHGTNRPRNRWATRCIHCGSPDIYGHHRRGICKTCYQYQWRTGKPRPKRLFEHLKYCDCGNHATRTIHTAHGDYDVCEACYQLEHSYSGGGGSAQAGAFDARRMDYHT